MKRAIHQHRKLLVLSILCVFPAHLFSQALLNANGTTDTYTLINSILAPGATAEETPDAYDPSFGPHIKQVWDSDLGKYVFEFYLHIDVPLELQDEATGDTDRQRVEIKTYAPSPDSLKGVTGETVKYKWQFKVPTGLQPSLNFFHIHQVKAVDGLDSDPIFTLTPRYNASGNIMQLIYVDSYSNNTTETTASLSLFENTWVEATEQIRIDSVHGSYSIVIKKVSDGTTLLSYSNNDIQTIRYNNTFIRPKWGIYRSLSSISYLRNETMRFNSFSIQEIKNQAQTITFPTLPISTFGDANFDPGASTSAGLSLNVTYTSSNTAVATIVNDSVHIVGAGTSIITAKQAGDASYSAATNVTQTLIVAKSSQTIAFSSTTKAIGDADFSPATASSGLTPTYASSNTAVATIVSGKIHVVGAGTATITASQVGNTNYLAATDVAQTLTVTTSALYTYSPTSITVTSGSTGSGTYANLASNDASYLRLNSTSSGTRTLDWYGSVTVSQSASSIAKLIVNYDGHNQISRTQILYLYNFTTSTWTQIDSRTVSTSDVSVTYEQTSPSNFISSGGVIRLRVYSSGGTQNYTSFADYMQFTLQNVTKSNQTISFASLPTKTYGDVDFAPGATASSGLAVSYSSSNTAVATIVSNQIHIVGPGTSTITASQAGDSYNNTATDVAQILTVSKANQTITFNTLSSKSVGMADFNAGATASSGLTVSYASSNTSVATIVSGLVHIIGVGTTTITASQTGDTNTNAATDATQTLTVSATSTVLMEETFNYTAGDLNAQGSWTTAGTYTGGTGYTIGSDILTYSDAISSYTLSGSGKSMLSNISTSAVDYKAYKPFSASSVSSGAIYLSFLFKANANITSTNQELFGLADGTSAGPKVLIGKTNTGFLKIGTVRGSTTSGDYKYATTPTSLIVGDTYFVVLKYDFSTSTSSIYINPTIAGSESSAVAEISDNTSATIRTKLSNLWVRAQGTVVTNSTIGGVRVSTSWDDAVASATVLSQTISFGTLSTKLTTDADFSAGATSSSGLSVSLSSSNTAVATIVNGQIHIVGVGTTTITASQAGNTSYSAAVNATQTLTVTKANQTITFGSLGAKLMTDADFGAGATASSGLSISLASSNTAVATIVSGQIHIVGAGTTTITASQVGDGNYNAAPDVSQTLTVNKVSQTITFGSLASKLTTDADFSAGATASSGLTVSLSSSNTAVATIVSGQIHIVGAGTTTITASQAGNTIYSAATDVSQALTVANVALAQTITFNTLAPKTYGDADFSAGATASSGLTISLASSNTSVATIVSGLIHIVGAGTSTITASQAGNTDYNAASNVTQTLTVNKQSQTITFSALSTKITTDADFSAGATASSGLTVSLASSNTAVATIVSGQIHIVGAGTSTITASQAGDGNRSAAIDVSQTLTVNKISQTITFGAIATKYPTDADFSPGATASSGLTVTYVSSNSAVATIVSNQIHIVGVGTSTITASQAGNNTYYAAGDVIQTLTVTSVLMDETFNYSATNLANEATWTTAGTLTTGTGRNIVSSALTYSDGTNAYILSGTGKTMNADISSTTDYKSYKGFGSTVSSGSIYLTFMYKAGVAQAQTSSEVFGLATGTSAGAQVWVGKGSISTSNYRFGTTRGSTTGTDVKWGATEFADVNAVILVVLKYDFTTSTSSIFLNPTLGSASEPTAETSDNTSTTTRSSLNNLWFRNTGSSSAKYNVGGARVSTTWTDAVAKNIATKLVNPTSSISVTSYGKTIFASEVGTMRIYNLQGSQVLLAEKVNNVDTHLTTGFYIVQFTSETGQKTVQKIAIR